MKKLSHPLSSAALKERHHDFFERFENFLQSYAERLCGNPVPHRPCPVPVEVRHSNLKLRK